MLVLSNAEGPPVSRSREPDLQVKITHLDAQKDDRFLGL